MARRKTIIEFIEEIKIKRSDLIILGEYVNNGTQKSAGGYHWRLFDNDVYIM